MIKFIFLKLVKKVVQALNFSIEQGASLSSSFQSLLENLELVCHNILMKLKF
jgi:hypothetical protein